MKNLLTLKKLQNKPKTATSQIISKPSCRRTKKIAQSGNEQNTSKQPLAIENLPYSLDQLKESLLESTKSLQSSKNLVKRW